MVMGEEEERYKARTEKPNHKHCGEDESWRRRPLDDGSQGRGVTKLGRRAEVVEKATQGGMRKTPIVK